MLFVYSYLEILISEFNKTNILFEISILYPIVLIKTEFKLIIYYFYIVNPLLLQMLQCIHTQLIY